MLPQQPPHTYYRTLHSVEAEHYTLYSVYNLSPDLYGACPAVAVIAIQLLRMRRQMYGGKTGIPVHQQGLPLHSQGISSLADLSLAVPSKGFGLRDCSAPIHRKRTARASVEREPSRSRCP